MDLSRRRKALQQLYRQLGETLEIFFIRKPFLRGSLYELKRQCGKPQCRCQRGELHRVMVLTWSEGGKKHLRVVKAQELAQVERLTSNYRRFRRARVRVRRIGGEILRLTKQIERELLRQGAREKR